jgi:hypothetical protein
MGIARLRPTAMFVALVLAPAASAATVVPTEIKQPGTQPQQVGNLESPDKCDNCHGGYNTAVEPAFNWRGSMMAQAGRDPLFWATLAIAEQDFDGAGDLCLRCHSPEGWMGGRSTPTDGSGLQAGDSAGVSCDLCHKMTNPDRSEHLGVQTAPFLANDEKAPATGYYGAASTSSGAAPTSSARTRTPPPAISSCSRGSTARRTSAAAARRLNPAVGDLAPGNGAQPGVFAPVIFSGVLGSPVDARPPSTTFLSIRRRRADLQRAQRRSPLEDASCSTRRSPRS